MATFYKTRKLPTYKKTLNKYTEIKNVTLKSYISPVSSTKDESIPLISGFLPF